MGWPIRGIPTVKGLLDGTEWLTGQEAAGGAGSSFRFRSWLIFPPTVQRTADATLTSADANTIQANTNATAIIQLALWSPTAGDRISFVRRAPYELRLAPASGLKVGEGDTNAVLTMLTEGRLNLRCYDAGHWVVESHSAEYDYL